MTADLDQVRALRRVSLATGVALLAETAAVAGHLVARREPVRLPLRIRLGSPVSAGRSTPVDLGEVQLAAATLVPPAFLGVVRVAAALPPLRSLVERDLARGRRTLRWLEQGVTASVPVFLVAQLNGVDDAAALMELYAMESSASLLAAVQERVGAGGAPMLPMLGASVVGLVPWGAIALHQLGAGLRGDPPPATVRTTTLLMLSIATAQFVVHWRELQRQAEHPDEAGAIATRGERIHVLMSAASTSLFAGLVALRITPPKGS